ncbi:hypothetical protein JQC91_08690 [Jannaschia sp. Os4]|uniref:glutaredoxin domain-containing protein n=1 Tax=Jannaschia sp. Os4 TaxID=2807617 RepID=UPI00193ABC87|nr:glutaredoxin domain-containing protein [Jannaschia sp. Os4]MBM2576383.1 hypothetical protein [Jannaschia sp. Os4]
MTDRADEPIQIFTKPDCPYCAKVKDVLAEASLPYGEVDVTASDRNANLAVFLSGVSTVPQTFVGDTHVNGSGDVSALRAAERLIPLAARADGPMDLSIPSDAAVGEGAEDLKLRDVIPEVDGSTSDVPEDQPILRMYKEFFGFWPNCFYYQYHWPEVAYRQFVYCHNAGAIGGGKKVTGSEVMNALGYATSNAQGCNYCQVHSASVGEDDSAGYAKAIDRARRGDHSGTFGPFEAALAELVAHSSTNEVTEDDLALVHGYADEARFTKLGADANVEAASMIAAAFGFLNVFNDLTGVKVEAEWAEKAESGAGIETGRHGADDGPKGNLDHDIPEGGPSMARMLAHYGKDAITAGGPARYAEAKLGMEPAWMAEWPLPLRPLHARFYVGVMTDEDAGDVSIAPELKHLMARVSHVAKGNDYLAASEGWLAWHAAGRTERAVERVRHAFDAAKDRPDAEDLFDEAERAALKLAWLSAQVPLTTPRAWVQPAVDAYDPTELVHLITVCAMASMIQRFSAIAMPKVEPQVDAFLREHRLPLDTLAIRYPLRGDRAAAGGDLSQVA